MFLMIGISDGRKDFDCSQSILCRLCGKVYELDPEIGRRIARGEQVNISDSDLRDAGYSGQPMLKTCSYCGYSTYEDFQYCPKCEREF